MTAPTIIEPHPFVMGKDLTVCDSCGKGINTDVHNMGLPLGDVDEGEAPEAEAPATEKKARGRKKAVKNQRTIDDLVIEDPELEEALALISELEPHAAAFREARHKVKTLIQTEHEEVINALTADGKPRYAVVGNHRLIYKVATRPAAKKPAAAGVSTKLEIFVLNQ